MVYHLYKETSVGCEVVIPEMLLELGIKVCGDGHVCEHPV